MQKVKSTALGLFATIAIMLVGTIARGDSNFIAAVTGETRPDPDNSIAYVTLRNRADQDIKCTVKVEGIVVGRSSVGNTLTAHVFSEAVVGFTLPVNRSAERGFNFAPQVSHLRSVWHDTTAQLVEVLDDSIDSSCTLIGGGSGGESTYYVQSLAWDAIFQDSSTDQEIFRLKLHQPSFTSSSVSYSADGQLVAFAGSKHVEVLGLPDQNLVGSFTSENDIVRDAKLTPNGRYLVVNESRFNEQGSTWIRVWDVNAHSTLALTKVPFQIFPTNNLAVSPDNTHLAYSNPNGDTVVILNLQTLALETSVSITSPAVLTYSPDGRFLAVGGNQYTPTIKVLRTSDGAVTKQLQELQPTQSMAFTKDGTSLLIGSSRNNQLVARMWSLATQSVSTTFLDLPSGNVKEVSLSPDGAKALISYFEWDTNGQGKPEEGAIYSLNGQLIKKVSGAGSQYRFSPLLPSN